eukprot:GHRR01002217.1.p1 GENE.GHRR01002217.1~~GHRR01002217.1.p1  ORF type:complete len:556 (+),score=221.04 GHRR01002217.1:104-1771(+)
MAVRSTFLQASPGALKVITVRHGLATARHSIVRVYANGSENRANSRKGKQFEQKNRRRGRPAWMRSPYDTPLRDGNRDRLIGLLTERAAKTLMVYLMETNANVYSWLISFYKENPIPKHGSWDEVSGEAFLRKLLSMPIEEAKFNTGRDSLFDNVRGCGVDPRQIAQRIMDIRTQLSEEFVQDLKAIAEENSLLLRETLQTSLARTFATVETTEADATAAVHPKLADSTDAASSSNSSSSSSNSSMPSSSNGKLSSAASQDKPQQPTQSTGATDSLASSSKPPGWSQSSNDFGRKDYNSSSPNPETSAGSDVVNKAAAIAALNAALKASMDATPTAGSHPELLQGPTSPSSGNSATDDDAIADPTGDSIQAAVSKAADDSMSRTGDGPAGGGELVMQDVIAQLKRSLDAEAAELTSWDDDAPVGTEAASGTTEVAEGSQSHSNGSAEADLSPDQSNSADESTQTVIAAFACAEELGSITPSAGAAAAIAGMGTAGGQTRWGILPKGWGPRQGLGFDQGWGPDLAQNNIVSMGQISTKGAAAAAAVTAAADVTEAQ